MKYLFLFALLFLTGCTSGNVATHVVEHVSNTPTAGSASACNQLRMECASQPGEFAGANGQYYEWENPDGSMGCSCDKQ